MRLTMENLLKKEHSCLKLKRVQGLGEDWDWIDSVNRSKKWPGKYWDEWIVTTKPIIDYKILEVEDGWE